MNRLFIRTAIATALLMGAFHSVHAGFVGSNVHAVFTRLDGVTFLDQTATVGDTVEFSLAGQVGSYMNADFGDSSLQLTFIKGSTGSIGQDYTWTFTLDPTLVFVSISEQLDTFINGVSLIGLSDSTATFRISDQQNLGEPTYNALYSVAVRSVDAAEVPEPASLALVGLGLAGLAATRRRKQA